LAVSQIKWFTHLVENDHKYTNYVEIDIIYSGSFCRQ